jgi:hypothetical protein
MIQLNKIFMSALLAVGFLVASSGPATAQGTPKPSQKQSGQKAAQKKASPGAKAGESEPLELEPKAIDLIKATSSRLAAAHTLTFTAVETFESLSRQGVPLVYGNKFEAVLQRPNKLRVILSGDGPASEFYDDGTKVMAYAPQENLIAIADAQPTIDKTLESVYHSAGIYFPFTDLIVTDPYGDMAPGLKHAYYVGQSKMVAGVTTDVVAFAGNGVFVEMWIGAEDKLPRVIHAIYLDDPDHLRHNMILSDWKIDPAISDETFTTSKASSAKPIEFAHPHPEQGPGARPNRKAKATASALPKTGSNQPR